MTRSKQIPELSQKRRFNRYKGVIRCSDSEYNIASNITNTFVLLRELIKLQLSEETFPYTEGRRP